MITAGPRDKLLLNVELVLGMVLREPDPVGVSRSPFEKSLRKVPSREVPSICPFEKSPRKVPSVSFRPRSPRSTRATVGWGQGNSSKI